MTRTGRRAATRTAGALVTLCLVTACAPGGEIPAEPAAEATVETAAPRTEATAVTEAPDGSGNGGDGAADGGADVAVELPGLPIGGSSSVVSDSLQCVDVGWSDPPLLPDGLDVAVTGVGFSPADGFALSSAACPGAPSCLDPAFRLTADGPRCAVAVTWTDPAAETAAVMFFTSGVLACPAERIAECEAFRDAVATGGAQGIDLELAPFEPETAPSEPETAPSEPETAPSEPETGQSSTDEASEGTPTSDESG